MIENHLLKTLEKNILEQWVITPYLLLEISLTIKNTKSQVSLKGMRNPF
jgi:hypothetical protein